MRKAVGVVVMLVMMAAVSAWGQEASKASSPPSPDLNAAYKLDYVMAEIEDGKRVNTRTYTVMTDDGGEGRLNQGLRVPVSTGDKGMQYMDVGLHINARVRTRPPCGLSNPPQACEENRVWLSSKFELSGLIEQPSGASGNAPTLRTIEYATPTVVTLGKATVLASGDDLGSKKRFELSVTVTKVR
jgi:hypothetical protein